MSTRVDSFDGYWNAQELGVTGSVAARGGGALVQVLLLLSAAR